MIENIRKYNILIIIGLVVVAAALVIGLNSSGNMRGPGGNPYIKIGSRTYTDTEYRQYGISSREIVESLAQAGDFQRMYQFLFTVAPNSMFSQTQEDSTETFFINRMLIRQAKNDFGIHPSDEQIDEFTRSLAAFRGADQEFDPEMYARYIEKGLGRMGMSERHFRELASDIIATDLLRGIISSGLLVQPDVAASRNALDQQKISGSVARLELGPFKETIKPTDEELKAYWELIQDAFKTEEQRRFSYILVKPDITEEQASTEEDKKPGLVEAAMTDAQKAAAAKEKAEKEAKLAEEKRLKQRELDAKVDDFTYALEENQGRDFEKFAAEYGWEIHTTALFGQSAAPDALKLDLRTGGRGGDAISELFRMTVTDDPISKISHPMAVGENQWLVARLDEIIPSQVKTFEEALDEVRKQYIEEKAAEALEKAMGEAADQVAKALEEGKAFPEAAIGAGLSEITNFEQIASNHRADKPAQPDGLFGIARALDPGKASKAIVQGDLAYLVFVAKREVEEGANSPEELENQISITANQNSMAAFSDWLKFEQEAAAIKRLYSAQ